LRRCHGACGDAADACGDADDACGRAYDACDDDDDGGGVDCQLEISRDSRVVPV